MEDERNKRKEREGLSSFGVQDEFKEKTTRHQEFLWRKRMRSGEIKRRGRGKCSQNPIT